MEMETLATPGVLLGGREEVNFNDSRKLISFTFTGCGLPKAGIIRAMRAMNGLRIRSKATTRITSKILKQSTHKKE